MINSTDLSGKIAFDANSLNGLKNAAKENSPDAIKGVAKQFEAIFMNMMLKSMRAASPQDNPFDNEQSRTFTSMLDQQLSSNLASKGLGLADVLARQLSQGSNPVNNTMEQAVTDTPPSYASDANVNAIISNPLTPNNKSVNNIQDFKALINNNSPTETSLINNKVDAKSSNDSTTEFKNRMSKHAEEASRTSGMPAHLMLGQAALESGWGKRELKGADGTPSNNLFGIKATGNWDGKVIEATTTEYIHGVKQKRIEKFRAYDSYADSFKDFANMMNNNPRYNKVMANLDSVNGYAQAMQSAGYATDPNYASKLASVIQKVIP
ncbi:MAG: flagellar assembly peptidoglycan hydrolase FlgJ [Methylotenera sp.]|uniref:flagellar assembly peptidoglycan hydrolase FlgJ n=1 Tax=Methylotenera sp. TaxID=2051956 RepID=UPI002489DCB4|nr:flagellar assembly peptidoglycan hydrolase FlgJ [Methylotenera sp.]MDI1308047.1 flagellar assembly peptidoglycan hydrolase FlgJ [Methylotenera sp.]